MKAIKIIGILILLIGLLAYGLYLFIKFKTNNVEDKQNLEVSIDKQATKYIKEGNSLGLVIGVVKNGKTFLVGRSNISLEFIKDLISKLNLNENECIYGENEFFVVSNEKIYFYDFKFKNIIIEFKI